MSLVWVLLYYILTKNINKFYILRSISVNTDYLELRLGLVGALLLGLGLALFAELFVLCLDLFSASIAPIPTATGRHLDVDLAALDLGAVQIKRFLSKAY